MTRTAALAIALLAVASATFPPRPAAAQAAPLRTTGDLLALCDAPAGGAGAVRLAQCNGFIVGTGLFYLELLRAGTIEAMACAPDNTTLDEARLAFVAWARGNAAEQGTRVIDGFWKAMGARWPCRT